jgi:L-alanine-DL-glutamate epimerase-like enolase superfamily enzyme
MEFLKPAKTSRGEYIQKTSILLSLSDNQHTGIGEAAPLPDLSIDGKVDLAAVLSPLLDTELAESDLFDLLAHWEPGESEALPSLRFALHAAWKNLQFQQHNKPTSAKQTVHWANNDFTAGKRGLKINGLVWMNGVEAMYEEAISKFKAGFRCIKIKVGALDFDEECRLIERIRKHYTAFALELRLDANGGFQEDAALEQLKELKRFEIHSIEQPVRAGSPSLDQI